MIYLNLLRTAVHWHIINFCVHVGGWGREEGGKGEGRDEGWQQK